MSTIQKMKATVPLEIPLHRPVITESPMINGEQVAPHRSAMEQHVEAELKRPTKTFSSVVILFGGLVIAAGFAGMFLVGWLPREHNYGALTAETERIKNSLPRVRVVRPRQSPAATIALLPGDVQAMDETTIYARTSGYISKWLVDIGDQVKEGELLAQISTPEIFAQLQQSKAALAESKAAVERAKATVNLTTITTNRIRGLVAKKTVSQQDLDDSEGNQAVAIANLTLAEATVQVNTASVQHMQELQSFSEIRAPFAGTITARNINTGQLVTSGSGTGQSLFHLAQTNPVRVFVNVPQIIAPGVTQDLRAEILVRELPGRVFEGTVTRTARAIDPLTRTLLTEIQVPNDDHALLVGSYVQVRMQIERQDPPLLIPAVALVFNAESTQVAVVGPDQKIQLRAVTVVGDFGSDIGISTGITMDDQVVANPGDRMSEGLHIEIETEPETSPVPKSK